MSHPELLDEQVVYQRGLLQRVRRWWKGIHPRRGMITWGWTGWETVEEKDGIVPTHTFWVAATSQADRSSTNKAA